MSKTKQKPTEQNGRVQEITPEAAQQVLDAAERARRERFQVEYQRLCAEYGYEVAAQPMIAGDGRIGVMMTVIRRPPEKQPERRQDGF